MFDRFDRKINYLRISVTDRCNLRCRYCMPEDGLQMVDHSEILTLEEILEIARQAVEMGIDKIRLTGGEPLVRRNILFLVREIAAIRGLRDFGMTSNGILLVDMARPLVEAGLHRINISLDTLRPERYAEITRTGSLEKAVAGILAAKEAGFRKIKLNCVVRESSSEPDAVDVAAFAARHDLEVRFIRQMDLDKGEFWVVEGGTGGDCGLCNRLRLSCTGLITPCLFNDLEFSVKELGIREAITLAVEGKPAGGHRSRKNTFFGTGG